MLLRAVTHENADLYLKLALLEEQVSELRLSRDEWKQIAQEALGLLEKK